MKKIKLYLLCTLLVVVTSFSLLITSGNKNLTSVSAVETGSSTINPIAKYEFLDSNNPGKDSMGNYDLELMYASGKDSSNGGVSVANGVASFDGTAGLRSGSEENDLSENLESFTMSFDIKASGENTSWAIPIGFGFDGTAHTAENKWFFFALQGGKTDLRFNASNKTVDGKSDIMGSTQWYGPTFANVSDEKNITVTVELGGNIVLYVDGVSVKSYETPENYTLSDAKLEFSIGCVAGKGNSNGRYFVGEMSNVVIYDFALNDSQVNDYITNGDVYLTKNEIITSLLKKYYNGGIYQKDTIINLSEEAKDEASVYFHAQCNELERTTYYNGNELYMTNASKTVNSGYGTDANGNMTHFYYDKNDNKVIDYTVKIANKGGMEEYYNTLFDLSELDYSDWVYKNGIFEYSPKVPSNTNEWILIFRDITAPCFLNVNDETSQNYLSFEKVTIEESNGSLILKLYVSSTDSGKLTSESLVFSQAVITIK